MLITAHCIDYIREGENDYSRNQINSSHNAFTQDLITADLMYLMVPRPAVHKTINLKVVEVTRDS